VRFSAAMALGKIGNKAAFEPLVALLADNDDKDPILRHGGIMGLVGCGTAEQIAALSKNASVAVRGDACVALRRLQSPLVAAFLDDADESVVLEAARAINDAGIEAAMPALAKLTTKPLTNPHILSRAVNANYRAGKAENARALAALAVSNTASEAARKEALDALAVWGHPNPKDRLVNLWRPLPDRGPEDAVAAVGAAVPALLRDAPATVQEQVAKLVAKLSIPGAGEPLAVLASNDNANGNARLEALKTLAAMKDANLEKVTRAAVLSKDGKLRAQALQILAEMDPAVAATMIDDMVNKGSVVEKQGAVLALGQMKGNAADKLIGGLLDKLIANQLPGEIQIEVLETAGKKRNVQEIKDKLAKYNDSLPKTDELAKYRVSLLGGNAESGRKLFREKIQTECLRCHKAEIGNSEVGPDLTHIGATRDRNSLLESIVLPSKTIAPGFETVVLTLANGDIVAGTLAGEDATSVKIKVVDAEAKVQVQSVPVAQIKERQKAAASPMPPGMGDILSRQELRDIIEYLSSLK
jgi:putative heme-binding domain-containing protein